MDLPLIRQLDPGFVPHSEWAFRKWFFAHPLWYYHRPREDDELRPSRQFYEHVDPALREICLRLHEEGLHTTPSCEGHFYGRDRFERIWAELTREAEAIRGEGLVVTDSESEQKLLFGDDSYRLPWRSFGAFYAEAAAQQVIGYLGILIPSDRGDLRRLFEGLAGRIAPASTMELDDTLANRLGSAVFSIRVTPRDEQEKQLAWREATARVVTALDQCPIGACRAGPADESLAREVHAVG